MSFTDQKSRVATDKDCEAPWSGNKRNFRCYLCGHKFKTGDVWRWVYGDCRTFSDDDGKTWGVSNFLVCDKCDGEDVLDRWVKHNKEFYSGKFWSFRGKR